MMVTWFAACSFVQQGHIQLTHGHVEAQSGARCDRATPRHCHHVQRSRFHKHLSIEYQPCCHWTLPLLQQHPKNLSSPL